SEAVRVGRGRSLSEEEQRAPMEVDDPFDAYLSGEQEERQSVAALVAEVAAADVPPPPAPVVEAAPEVRAAEPARPLRPALAVVAEDPTDKAPALAETLD